MTRSTTGWTGSERRDDDICAMCESLTTKGHPEQMARGEGRCTGYDGSFTPLANPFVAWNTPACVLFTRSADEEARAARRRWIEKQEAKQETNDVQTETKG